VVAVSSGGIILRLVPRGGLVAQEGAIVSIKNVFNRAKNFNRTLLKIFSSPPQPLHKIREPINQTLPENFSADPA